jgi:C1A family cysteine protease
MSHAKGWRPQKPDHRDRAYAAPEGIMLEPKLSLRSSPFNPGVYDQLQIGTCVPNSNGSMFEFVLRKLGLADFMPSRLFIYALGRELEGTPLTEDSGMEVRDALKVLAQNGVCPETVWPYSDANPGPFQQQPSAEAIAAAQQAKVIQYLSLSVPGPGAPLRSCLAEGYPFTFGFSVPAQLESEQMASGQQKLLPLPNQSDNPLTGEGHGVKCVGYDFTCQTFPVPVFEIKNSWNESWCDGGYFYLDYRYFGTPQIPALATDIWTLRSVS